jgi:hypothetical protein
MKTSLSLLFSMISLSSSLKIAIINDIHLNPNYDPLTSRNKCWGDNYLPGESDKISKNLPFIEEFALYGRVKCDPPMIQL